jgi:hypothetical protein
MKKVK